MLTVKGKKVGMKRRAIMRDFFERYSSCLKNPHDAKNAALCAGSISNWKKDLLFNEKSCPCSIAGLRVWKIFKAPLFPRK